MFSNTSKSSARASCSLRPRELHTVLFPLSKMAATDKATTLQATLSLSSCAGERLFQVLLKRLLCKDSLPEHWPIPSALGSQRKALGVLFLLHPLTCLVHSCWRLLRKGLCSKLLYSLTAALGKHVL